MKEGEQNLHPYKRKKPSFIINNRDSSLGDLSNSNNKQINNNKKSSPKEIELTSQEPEEIRNAFTVKRKENKKDFDKSKKKSKTVYKKKQEKKRETRIETFLINRKNPYYDKSKINLSPEQRKYTVNIIKRNYNNNIYLNNIDQSISFVIPYKYKCSLYMFLLSFL